MWVVTRHLSQAELRGLYAAADAFVLPSRGEGWGRPHVEAMSMALPGAHKALGSLQQTLFSLMHCPELCASYISI